MGYNLKVEARSTGLRDKMVRFMEQNYRVPGAMAGPPEAHEKKNIVVEYSSCLHGAERVHVYSVVGWMALKIGALRSRFSRKSVDPNIFDPPVPFIVYDSYERWPILACGSEEEAMKKWPKSLWWCTTDHLGMHLGARTSESIVLAAMDTAIFDSKKAALLEEEMKTIGNAPHDNAEWEEWIAKKRAIQAKFYQQEVQAMTDKIRSEIGQMDEAWKRGD